MHGMIKVLSVVSIKGFKAWLQFYISVHSTGNYTVEKDNGCSISLINGTSLIYETANPYGNYNECNAEFNCPDDKIIRYSIERFDIEQDPTCRWDSLGLYNIINILLSW